LMERATACGDQYSVPRTRPLIRADFQFQCVKGKASGFSANREKTHRNVFVCVVACCRSPTPELWLSIASSVARLQRTSGQRQVTCCENCAVGTELDRRWDGRSGEMSNAGRYDQSMI
jgi:hypothetical protein